MSSSSFDHKLTLYRPAPNPPAWAITSAPLCTSVFGRGVNRSGCKGKVVYVASYRYVSGQRSGRTTTNRRLLCADCAATFARRNGLMSPAPGGGVMFPVEVPAE